MAAGTASAGPVFDLVVYENADGVPADDVRVQVEVRDISASQIAFIITNASAGDNQVTDIFFEETAFSSMALDSATIVDNADADFDAPSDLMAPAGNLGPFGGAWQGTLFSAEPNATMPIDNALGAGESISIFFGLDAPFDDVVGAFASDPLGLRIAARVQGIGAGDASVWVVTPAPGAAALLGLAGIVATRRRR